MDNYIINTDTIAIIGIDRVSSKIIERDREFIINLSSIEIIENSCLYYGSSLQGRIDAASKIIFNSYKVPILINNKDNLVFFPTISPSSNQCIWISINEIYELNNNNSLVTIIFKNGSKIDTNLSLYSLENQMCKSYRFSSIMYSRNFS